MTDIEKARYEKRLSDLEQTMAHIDRYDRQMSRANLWKAIFDPERAFTWFGFLVVVAAVIGIGICFYKVATSSGKPDYCMTTVEDHGWVGLKAHRPWAEDHILSSHPNMAEALAYAEKIGCPVK